MQATLDVAYVLLADEATWVDRIYLIRSAFGGADQNWIPSKQLLDEQLAAYDDEPETDDDNEELADVIDIVSQLNRFSVVRGV